MLPDRQTAEWAPQGGRGPGRSPVLSHVQVRGRRWRRASSRPALRGPKVPAPRAHDLRAQRAPPRAAPPRPLGRGPGRWRPELQRAQGRRVRAAGGAGRRGGAASQLALSRRLLALRPGNTPPRGRGQTPGCVSAGGPPMELNRTAAGPPRSSGPAAAAKTLGRTPPPRAVTGSGNGLAAFILRVSSRAGPSLDAPGGNAVVAPRAGDAPPRGLGKLVGTFRPLRCVSLSGGTWGACTSAVKEEEDTPAEASLRGPARSLPLADDGRFFTLGFRC